MKQKYFAGVFVGAVMLALAALPAQGQYMGGLYGAPVLSLVKGTTNIVAAGTTNFTATALPCQNSRNVTFFLSVSPSDTNPATAYVSYVKSLDGTHFESTPSIALMLTCPGYSWGTAVVAATNVDMGAWGYFSPYQFTNSACSNVLTEYSLKPGY